MLTIDTIKSERGFQAIKEEWHALLDSAQCKNIFLTWEWMHTWWEHLSGGRQLHIVTVRRGGKLIALAPLSLRPPDYHRLIPFRVLEFLGSGDVGSDYLSIIVGEKSETDILRAIANYLVTQKFVLDLAQFESNSLQMTSLLQLLEEQGWKAARLTTNQSPFIELKDHSWESYCSSLGRSHRTNLRKRIKNLRNQFTVELELINTESRRAEALEQLIELHLKRWQSRGGSTAMHKPELIAFHHAITRFTMKLGWLRFYVLKLDGRAVASMYCFNYGDKYYYYQTAFDDAFRDLSVGLVGTAMAIQSAIEEGAQEYDFLHGDESYKYLWTSKQRELSRLILMPPSAWGALYRKVWNMRQGVKQYIFQS